MRLSDCLASYFLLALCQRKFIISLPRHTHTHTQLNNKRYFNWADYTRYMECGYLCQSEQGALVQRFHWNTRNMSSHFCPSNSYFIYANMSIAMVCVGWRVCGRGRVESLLCFAKQQYDMHSEICCAGYVVHNRPKCFTLDQVPL